MPENWPRCFYCKREVRPGGHLVETCARIVQIESDWFLWKFGR